MNAIVFCTNFWFCRRLSSLLRWKWCFIANLLLYYKWASSALRERSISIFPNNKDCGCTFKMEEFCCLKGLIRHGWFQWVHLDHQAYCVSDFQDGQKTVYFRTCRSRPRNVGELHAYFLIIMLLCRATCQNSRLCKTTPGWGSNSSIRYFKVKIIRIFSSTYVGWPL